MHVSEPQELISVEVDGRCDQKRGSAFQIPSVEGHAELTTSSERINDVP